MPSKQNENTPKWAPTRRNKTSKWCLFVLVCCLLAALHDNVILTISGQQQAINDNNLINNQRQQTQRANQRVGLAPHDRPACQLPPIVTQRRHSASPEADSQQALNTVNPANSNNDSHPNHRPAAASGQTTILAPNIISLSPPANSYNHNASGQLKSAAPLASTATSTKRAVETSERLRQLRQLLVSNNYDAYLVTPNDEHGSEYVTDYDRRLRFISGFTGSNGYALILLDRAVLFTDGRYALQADQDLDCNWWLVYSDEPLADIHLWLKTNAAKGLKVAVDARLMSLQSFDYLDEHIRKLDSEFVLISQDLVDIVWSNIQLEQGSQLNGNKPSVPLRQQPKSPLFVHPVEFAGNISWQEKMIRLAESMTKLRARYYVIAQLDDIAWLLNLRGSDIPMSPLFKAYLLISRLSAPVSESASLSAPAGASSTATMTTRMPTPSVVSVEQLFAQSNQQQASIMQTPQVVQIQANQLIKVTLYVDLQKITQPVRNHLHLDNGTVVSGQLATSGESSPIAALGNQEPAVSSRIQVDLKDYDVFIMDFRDKFSSGGTSGKSLQGKLLLDANANVAIHVLAKNYDDRLVLVESLVQKMKSVKSDEEVDGMRQAHWRDSLAISMLLAQLELDIGRRKLTSKWTEISASKELEFYRSLMDFNRGQSFDTISAYGTNGAIVHYRPNSEPGVEQQPIGNQSTYLLDSGGQYLDGTTDITRTVHFGEPSEFQRETYTRVLMGAIDMMSLVFAQSDRSAYKLNDLLARRYLFEIGLDYMHGTGHGIGSYSMVHETPALIEHYASGRGGRQPKSGTSQQGQLIHSDPIRVQANMFTSVEPGYYKANDFGIRLENIVVTQRYRLPDESQQVGPVATWLRFEPISLVPFEPKLIRFELLSNKQKAWLNSYNLMVRMRMTQQINYYLAKIRQHQQQQQSELKRGGVTSSSRLYRQLQQRQWQQNVSSPTSDTLDSERNNFMRLESTKLQEILEQTHRWIMANTELIPLDSPQCSVNGNNRLKSTNKTTGGQQDEWSALGADLNGQRLMLAYMSSLPFNDQEAAHAAASLAGRAAVERKSALPNADGQGQEGTKSGRPSTCSGLECDLWLIEALNSQHRPGELAATRANGKFATDWPPVSASSHTDTGSGEQVLSLMADLFQLNGAINQSASKLIGMWPLLAVGLLLALQLTLMVCVCLGAGSRSVASKQATRRTSRVQSLRSQSGGAHGDQLQASI